MGNLTIATVFIVILNLLMWFSQVAVNNINPGGSVCYSLSGSIIENSATTSGNISTLNTNIIDQLPEAQTSAVSPGSSSVSFTDIFNSVLGFFKSVPSGLKYLYGIVSAPTNILKCLSLPNEIAVGLGVFWYAVSFMIVIIFIFRGND